ncbi:MAG: glycosyltransferase family 2 protein, partial [Mycobacteriales bacterium]
MTTPRDVTVVICTYAESRWQELAAAVSSVREQSTDAGVEIVLVVDSNPPLLQRVRETYADLVVIANREQRGLSGARNSGVQMARGE